MGLSGTLSVLISPDQELSENIWFEWSKTSYSGEKVGCDACPLTDGRRNVKIGPEFWKQNSQKCNNSKAGMTKCEEENKQNQKEKNENMKKGKRVDGPGGQIGFPN